MVVYRRWFFLVFLIGLATSWLSGQSSSEVDLNRYYRWPASISVGFQPLSSLGSPFLRDYEITEVAGEFRFPLGEAGLLQPLARGGLRNYTFVGDNDTVSQNWSHQRYFGEVGMGLSSRLSREFEAGLALWGGASQSVFTDLDSEVLSSGEQYGEIQGEAGGAISLALNPSYNLSLAVSPSVRYSQTFGSLDEFDGFSYGLGIRASYRFGRDPDASGSQLRAIRFGEVEMPPVFAAMRSYYAQEPITEFDITNREGYDLSDVRVQFFQEGFMDSPTELDTFDTIPSGESRDVDLLATYSEQVFTTQGVTPLNGEIIVSYRARGRAGEQRRSVSYELHDRNALTWDDDRKLAAFITPADSAVRNYASFIRRIHRDVENQFLSEPLQFAIQTYNALTELGVIYQIDPTSPFTEVQENTFVVDSVSFCRETLTRLTGDCDDLTVLFNTILQSAGIETGFVTTPGHIYSAVNTKVPSGDFEKVHANREMLLEVAGEIWVLVEITLIGNGTFMEAWSTGVSEYREYDDQPEARGFYRTGQAHETFRPVALRETDLGLQYGEEETIVNRFSRDMDALARNALAPQRERAQERDTARAWNRYGIAAAQFGAHGEAEESFNRARQLERDYLSPALNLGSLQYLRRDYRDALTTFEDAAQTAETADRVRSTERFKIYLNLSRTHYALENFEQAQSYFAEAQEIDSEQVQRFSFLGSGGGGEGSGAIGRASGAAEAEPILFFEE